MFKTYQIWWMACRPKTLSASLVPVFVGMSLAKMIKGAETLSFPLFFFSLLSALFIQIGTNLINDALDYKKGVDTHHRIGPARVTQRGLLSSASVLRGSKVAFGIAILFGIPLVLQGGWPILVLGLFSLLFGFLYTGGPYPLSHMGLGEMFVFLFFGLGAVGGSYYIQTLTFDFSVFITSLPIGFLCAVLMMINNLRDREQDQKSGKKTLAVRWGVSFSCFQIALLIFLSFLITALFWGIGGSMWVAFLPCLALPQAFFLVFQIYTHKPSAFYNSLLAQSSLLFMTFGCLLSLALFLS